MRPTDTIVLTRGGLKGLVAAALAAGQSPSNEVVLLQIADGRSGSRKRAYRVGRQAESLGIDRCRELALPHLFADHDPQKPLNDLATLARPQQWLAAMGYAMRKRAKRVIWPGACGDDTTMAAQLAEKMV